MQPVTQPSDILFALKEATFQKGPEIFFNKITLEVKRAEQWAIYGSVGAGKTTLVDALFGRYSLRSGQVVSNLRQKDNVSGQVVSLREAAVLVSFQKGDQLFNYSHAFYQQRYHSLESEVYMPTVLEVLEKAQQLAGTATNLSQVAKLLHIDDLLSQEVISLSNGQTRRVLIARALLKEPALLVLDNPYTGLDVQSRSDLNQIITQLIQHGTSVLLVTNQPELPENISNVMWLENFTIKGKYTRYEFLQELKAHQIHEQQASGIHQVSKALPQASDFKIAIQFENVTVKYHDKKILDNINWTIRKGEKWALLGPNGSGKSTLLSLINADNPQAYSNKIYLFDKRKGTGESIWDIKKRIGFVSPELHLYFRQNLKGEDLVASGFYDMLHRPNRVTAEQTELVQAHLNFFKRPDLAQKYFLQLSAGEQRILLLIRSLIKNPGLIIWDEPFQGLSPEYIDLATQLLQQYCVPSTTLLLVSHYSQEIPDFVHHTFRLENGKKKEE
ncbi:ATP-binding cassette domain-containing protein [Adhaeribacter aquaticus]|uniref:ATP-binding cassette domain-containing protein n=1 Tax=Adhaeribacter aquaticus TaxID=299567 RepID=UPI00040DD0EA|nr:ATP-binding cassette domain-containing protein [Adhaeribacter aquaticus]